MTGLTMTETMRELLDYIKQYNAKHDGVAPSFDQMREHMGLASKSGVHRLLGSLEERGKIYRVPSRARCIEVLDETNETLANASFAALSAEVERRGWRIVPRHKLTAVA